MAKIFKVIFYLKSPTDGSGAASILTRISFMNKRVYVGSTGYFAEPATWNPERRRIDGRKGDAMQINRELDRIETDLSMIFRKLEFSDNFSLEEVRDRYLGFAKEPPTVLFRYIDDYTAKMEKEVGVTRCEASVFKMKSMRKHLTGFMKKNGYREDMTLKKVNYAFIKDFERYLTVEDGLKPNTATRMLSTMRTVLKSAKNESLIEKTPFSEIRLSLKRVNREFLTEDEINMIIKKKMPCRRLEIVRDMFVFMCFTGLAYIDLKELSENNIVRIGDKTWIKTDRRKTGVTSSIPLLDIPAAIIEKYKGQASNGHVFPVSSAQKQNAYLKEIADLCGIDKNLTCHVARHTFATLALTEGVSIESVSGMLGHTNIKTTQIYARIINKKIETEMLRMNPVVQRLGKSVKD